MTPLKAFTRAYDRKDDTHFRDALAQQSEPLKTVVGIDFGGEDMQYAIHASFSNDGRLHVFEQAFGPEQVGAMYERLANEDGGMAAIALQLVDAA